MCKHEFVSLNKTKACIKCGLTILANGKIVFDKELMKIKGK